MHQSEAKIANLGKLISFNRAGAWSQKWDPWQPDLNRENWHMIPGMESLANWSHSTVGTWSQKFYLKWSLVKLSAYCSAELLITHKCASWMLCDWKGHTKLMFEGSLWTALKILSMLDFFFKVQICPFLLIFQHLICHLTSTTGAFTCWSYHPQAPSVSKPGCLPFTVFHKYKYILVNVISYFCKEEELYNWVKKTKTKQTKKLKEGEEFCLHSIWVWSIPRNHYQ